MTDRQKKGFVFNVIFIVRAGENGPPPSGFGCARATAFRISDILFNKKRRGRAGYHAGRRGPRAAVGAAGEITVASRRDPGTHARALRRQ